MELLKQATQNGRVVRHLPESAPIFIIYETNHHLNVPQERVDLGDWV